MAASKDSTLKLRLGSRRVVKDVLKAAWQRIGGRDRHAFRLLHLRNKSDTVLSPQHAGSQAAETGSLIPSAHVGGGTFEVLAGRVVRARPEEHVGSDAESEVASLGGNSLVPSTPASRVAGEHHFQDAPPLKLLDDHAQDEPLEAYLSEPNADHFDGLVVAMADRPADQVRQLADVTDVGMRANLRSAGAAIEGTNATLREINRRSLGTSLLHMTSTPSVKLSRKRRNSSWQTMPILQCTTCEFQPVGEEQFPGVPAACRDVHDGETCASCWQQWLETQIGSQSYDQISCSQCSNKLTQLDIKRLATEAVFERYLDSEVKATLAADDTFIWCLKPSCTSGQLHHGNEIFTCTNCDNKHCIVCRVYWHVGESCFAYQERTKAERDSKTLRRRLRREEESTADMIHNKTKLCPGPGCGRRVEKVGGCDHIVCTQCMFSFCWLCLASHQKILLEGNTAHREDCMYHSDNLKIAFPFNMP